MLSHQTIAKRVSVDHLVESESLVEDILLIVEQNVCKLLHQAILSAQLLPQLPVLLLVVIEVPFELCLDLLPLLLDLLLHGFLVLLLDFSDSLLLCHSDILRDLFTFDTIATLLQHLLFQPCHLLYLLGQGPLIALLDIGEHIVVRWDVLLTVFNFLFHIV